MGQCGCLDREKDKQRILQQLAYSSPQPLKQTVPEYNYYHQPSLSTNSHNRFEQRARNSYTNKVSQFSSRIGHQSYHSDTLSYLHVNQNNQFILINKNELNQFIRTNQQKIELIILNPLNPQQCIISFETNDTNDIAVQEISIKEQSFNKLYMTLKDFIASQEKRIVGIIPEYQYSIRIYYRILSQRQALNNAIEMQSKQTQKLYLLVSESVNQSQLEDIVNERLLDNLICCNIVQIQDQNLLFFQTAKRPLQTLNVIQLDLTKLNAINLSQDIAGKVEILQNNDVFYDYQNNIRSSNSSVYYQMLEANHYIYQCPQNSYELLLKAIILIFYFIMIFLLLQVSLAAWTKNPEIQTSSVIDDTSDYTISTEDFHRLRLNIQQSIDINGKQNYSDLHNFKKVSENELLHQGCIFNQKRLKIENTISLQLQDDNSFLYTDIQVINNTIYILRNDNKIFIASLVNNQFTLSSNIIDFNKYLAFDKQKHPYLIQQDGILYVITDIGAISYVNNTITQIKLQSINHLKNIHYDSNFHRLFIITNSDVQVYQINNTEFNYLYTINPNVIAIAVQTKGDRLFILDDKVGIHFYKLSTTSYDSENIQIPLENAKSFILKNNSFVVIAETDQGVAFAIEILINFETLSYYYNRFYLEDMKLRQVQETNEFLYLVGFDVHKIIYTNIFKGFADDEFDYDSDFMLPLLEKVQWVQTLEKSNSNQHTILGLTPNTINLIIINDHQPEIICDSALPTQQTYILQVNSTNCEQALNNPFFICQEIHKFHLKVNEVLLDSQQALSLEIFLIIVFLIFVFLVLCGIFMCRRWKQTMLVMQQKMSQDQKKQQQYFSVEQRQ